MPEKTETLQRQPYQQLTANLTFSHFFPENCGIAAKSGAAANMRQWQLKTDH
jgi:hypothetical protein